MPGEQLLDLSLGATSGRREKLVLVLGRQPPSQDLDGGQGEGTVFEQAEDPRERLARACDLYAVVGLVPGEMKLLEAIHVQRRVAGGEVDVTAVHLGQVNDQLRDRVVLAADEALDLGHQ